MAALSETILALEVKIDMYETQLQAGGHRRRETKSTFKMITSASETLNRWLDGKKEKAQQTFPFSRPTICLMFH
jgi:hypothetical protein